MIKQGRVLASLLLLILMVSIHLSFGRCEGEVPATEQVWIDNPGTRYILTNHSVDCYIKENDYRIRCNGKPVFVSLGSLQIIDFDVLQGFKLKGLGISNPDAATLIGVLLRRDQTIYLEIDDCQTGTAILVKELTRYHPWKLRFADVDGDNLPEVCLGVFKKSPLHPMETKRLFIFKLERGLPPQWLGSRLSRPFRDFEFMPPQAGQTGPERLFALEINQAGQICLNSYCWDSFGFERSPLDAANGDAENQRIFDAAASFGRGILIQHESYARNLYVMSQQQIISVYQEEAFQR